MPLTLDTTPGLSVMLLWTIQAIPSILQALAVALGGFGDKTRNGGSCTGKVLGRFAQLACNNLDNTFSARIKCVRYHQ